MKIKQYVTITNPLEFAQGNYHSCFNLFHTPSTIDGWIDCGEIEIEVNVEGVQEVALAGIEREEAAVKSEYLARIELLQQAKSELLCLEHHD